MKSANGTKTDPNKRNEDGSPEASPERNLTLNNASRLSANISIVHEEENFLSKKKEAPKSLNEVDNTPVSKNKQMPTVNGKEKLRGFMSSKLVEYVVIFLIIIYTLLVFVGIILDDGCNNSEEVSNAIYALKIVELIVITIFIVEIFLRILAMGCKGYFEDFWYGLDALIILATFALVIVDLSTGEDELRGLSRVRGVFRLFRIFLLMRKATTFSRLTTTKINHSGIDVKSPAERILEILDGIRKTTTSKGLKNELQWAIEIISTNKLYEPIIGLSGGQKKEEADQWIKSYGTISSPTRRSSKIGNREGLRRFSFLGQRRESAKTPSNSLAGVQIPQEALAILDSKAEDLSFDVLGFKEMTGGEELAIISYFLLEKHNFFDLLNIEIPVFSNFIRKIQSGYLPNPYHNATHAADVVQTVNHLIVKGDFIEKADLTNLEIFTMYMAAAVHDYEHPGTNNIYNINASTMYAIRYNDKAVLENHHVSATFALMKDESFNILKNLTKSDQKIARERMIAMVLGTDMATHFADIAKLKGRLAADFNLKDTDKHFAMNLIVHAADISNPVKPWDSCSQWAFKIIDEFWAQGDQERTLGLPISQLCDRYTTNKAKSQIGFIDFVVAPLFNVVKEFLPGIDISNLEKNKEKWKEQIEFYDKELAAVNEKKKADDAKNEKA